MKAFQAYTLFKQAYLQKVGMPYIETKKRDLAIFKGILKDVASEDLEELLDLYFKKDERFYSPIFFKTSLNELSVKLNHNKKHQRKKFEIKRTRWI